MTYKDLKINRVKRNTNKNTSDITIYHRLTILWEGKKERIEISSRISIECDRWKDGQTSIKGNTDVIKRQNQRLDSHEFAIRNLFDNYSSGKTSFNKSDFTSIINNKLFGTALNQVDKKVYIPDLFDRYVEFNKSKLGDKRAGRYPHIKGIMSAFLFKKFGTDKIEVNQINNELMLLFRNYIDESCNVKYNTAVGYMKLVKATVNDVLDIYDIRNPFKKIATVFKEGEVRYLTNTELNAIKTKKGLTNDMQQIRDIFLFSVFTGIAFCDIEALTSSNIIEDQKHTFLEFKRIKTGVDCKVPLLKGTPAERFITSHKNPDGQFPHKIVAMPHYNTYNEKLKTLAALCGIKPLTSHMGRHTFATTVWLDSGGQLESLQKILGHKNIRTTQVYGKVTQTKIAMEANSVASKFNSIKQ